MKLKDRVAVITGAATGLGFETARLFFREGARIVGVYHEKYDEKKIRDAFGSSEDVLYAKADITDPDEVKSVRCAVERKFGGIHILVNNAAVSSSGNIEETTEEEFKRVMDINVFGMFLVTKQLFSLMKKERSVIVNVASNIGLTGMAGRIAYTTSKGAVVNFTRSLALDCAPLGIRVNAIAPGAIYTEMVDDFFRQHPSEEFKKNIMAMHAMNRFSEPIEIARAILFLASDDSSYATGAIFSVDGGYTCGK